MNNVFEVFLLELKKDSACSVDNLSTILFGRSRLLLTSAEQSGPTICRRTTLATMTMEMTIPDYHNQSRLPTGVTISLWDDRSTIYNVDNIETTILRPENYKNLQWAEALDDNETYWFSAVTMTEYGTMLNDEGKIDKLPGSIRKPGNWEQYIMVPTSEEAIQWLAYHQSQGHTMSNKETVLIAISFEEHNLIHHQSQKMVTSFQRGYSVQVLQIHAPYDYQLTNKEMNKMRVMHLQYNAIDKFDRYNWTARATRPAISRPAGRPAGQIAAGRPAGHSGRPAGRPSSSSSSSSTSSSDFFHGRPAGWHIDRPAGRLAPGAAGRPAGHSGRPAGWP